MALYKQNGTFVDLAPSKTVEGLPDIFYVYL